MTSGGALLIDQLAAEGVRHLFTVPGESFIAALDAMHDRRDIRPVTCRNEATAAIAADATARVTGGIGACLVSRGPGAVNALPGLYCAKENASALVLIVALAPTASKPGTPFQHIDLPSMVSGLAKWCAIVPDASSIAHFVSRAAHISRQGRPGPVVLGIDERLLDAKVEQAAVTRRQAPARALSQADLEAISKALAHADRPLVIAGGPRWSESAARELATFAERFDLPVVTAFRRQDAIDNRHPCYAGHAGIQRPDSVMRGLRAADVVIAIGGEPDAVTSAGHSVFQSIGDRQALFVISDDGDAADMAYPAAVRMDASPIAATEALAALALPGKTPPWGTWRRDMATAYQKSLTSGQTPGDVKLEAVMATLRERLPDDAILTSGAGNYAAFLHRYCVFKSYPTLLAPLSGSMGYGLPAAIAASLAWPERTVVAIAGDGCFQMTGSDFATAVQYGLPIVVIVVNNGSLGTIRMHQEKSFPGRVIATSLVNPDFARLAESMGGMGFRVTSTDDFAPALEAAMTAGLPALIDIATSIEAILPDQTLAETSSIKL